MTTARRIWTLTKLALVLPILVIIAASIDQGCAVREKSPGTTPAGGMGNVRQYQGDDTLSTFKTNVDDAGVHTWVVDVNSMPGGGSSGTVVGAAASGSAVAGNPVLQGGSDGTNARTIKTDTSGNQVVVGAGTAGSNVGGVLTVQGNASGVAVPVSGTVAASSITTSVTPGTSAAHLGKAEDAAHSDGDTGVAAWSVRKDTAASTAGTTGDYAAITTDANGRTWTNNVITFAGTSLASSQVSNADFTSSAVSTQGYHAVWVTVTMSGSSSPVGTLCIYGSEDNSNFNCMYLDANKVYGNANGSAVSFAGGTTITVTGSSDSNWLIPIIDPPPYIKLFYDNTSGGTTGNRLNARVSAQSN